MIYVKTWECDAFQQKPIDPCPPSTNPRVRTCVIEPQRNLSFSAEHRRDFITIGTNVRKAIITLP